MALGCRQGMEEKVTSPHKVPEQSGCFGRKTSLVEGQGYESPRTYEKIEEEPVKHGGKVNQRQP